MTSSEDLILALKSETLEVSQTNIQCSVCLFFFSQRVTTHTLCGLVPPNERFILAAERKFTPKMINPGVIKNLLLSHVFSSELCASFPRLVVHSDSAGLFNSKLGDVSPRI